MNTLSSSLLDAWRCCHAPDGVAFDRRGSRARGRDSQQRAASSARGQSGSRPVLTGQRRSRSPDHGGSGNGANGCVAHTRSVSARWCGVGGLRCCALGEATPVRHGRRSASDGAGVFEAACGPAALDDGGTRAGRTPGAWHGQREPGNRAAHAQKNDLKPWRKLIWCIGALTEEDRKSTRLNSSHSQISYAVFCLKKNTPNYSPLTSFFQPPPFSSSLIFKLR